MQSTGIGHHRTSTDIIKLIQHKHKVTISNDNIRSLTVKFDGPIGSPYEGGRWYVQVNLPDQYPFKSPSIGFLNKIYHPNIDEQSGSVCLNALNQTWTALYDLLNIFESFLPQLLLYPNPYDSLNAESAHLYVNDRIEYGRRVCRYVERFAKEQNNCVDGADDNDDDDNSGSDMSESTVSGCSENNLESM